MIQKALYTHFTDYLETYPTHTLYGIFDGVKCPRLWSDLEEGILEYDMLFREEELRRELESVAPYLVKLDFQSEADIEQSKACLQWYEENGCIFMATEVDFATLLASMRELFYVYTPEGEQGFMRFYDPSVFRDYITQKDDNIRYALFSEVVCYWCEDAKDISVVHQYSKESTYTHLEKNIDLKEKELLKDV